MRALGVYHKHRTDKAHHIPRPSALVFGPDGRLFRRRVVLYFRPGVDVLLRDLDDASRS